MIPRGAAARTAATTSSALRGTRTCAVVGAVRPQPCRLVVLDIMTRLRGGRSDSSGAGRRGRTGCRYRATTVHPGGGDRLSRMVTAPRIRPAPRLGADPVVAVLVWAGAAAVNLAAVWAVARSQVLMGEEM